MHNNNLSWKKKKQKTRCAYSITCLLPSKLLALNKISMTKGFQMWGGQPCHRLYTVVKAAYRESCVTNNGIRQGFQALKGSAEEFSLLCLEAEWSEGEPGWMQKEEKRHPCFALPAKAACARAAPHCLAAAWALPQPQQQKEKGAAGGEEQERMPKERLKTPSLRGKIGQLRC